MWIQERLIDNRHDTYSKSKSRETSRTKYGPLHDICRITKIFDKVSRDVFWKIMAKYGFSTRFIVIGGQFYDGMQARVKNDSEYSEPFQLTNGFKQGCVMAPTPFSMLFYVIL